MDTFQSYKGEKLVASKIILKEKISLDRNFINYEVKGKLKTPSSQCGYAFLIFLVLYM
jgi:hypothetical protein